MLNSLFLALAIEICGSVQNQQGTPVEAATVRVQATNNSVLTDKFGLFCIDLVSSQTTLAASKEGYLISSQKVESNHKQKLNFTLHSLPKNSIAYEWLASLHTGMQGREPSDFQPCENCHARLASEWKTSAHANIEGDSLLNRLLNSKTLELPVSQCNLCHQPVETSEEVAIGCDFCHKINHVDTQDSLLLGVQRLSVLTPKEAQVFFGPLDDVARDRDSFLSLYQKSEYCAGCHQGRFWKTNVYSDYSEWQSSKYSKAGKQCQDCHMTTNATFTADKDKGGVLRSSTSLSSHHFSLTPQDVANAIEEQIEFSNQSDGLNIHISLTNTGAGHKIPGGNPMRHLILQVEVIDAEGKAVRQVTGSRIPNWVRGGLPGTPGSAYGKILVAQRGYQQKHKGKAIYPAPFWVNSYIESDNRLVPSTTVKESLFFAPVLRGRIKISLLLREHFQDWLDLGPAKTTVVFSKEFEI